MSRIVLLATGGTISSRENAAGGSRASDSAAQLLAALKHHALADLISEIQVETQDISVENSFNFSFSDLARIDSAVREILQRPEVDGVVVTHGTDTIEETLALLALTHDDDRPVVFTGAQRSPDHPDSDGPRNLRDAILVAADPASRFHGALLCFGGEIHTALPLRKAHASALQPFSHPSGGMLGRLTEAQPQYYFGPRSLPRLPHPTQNFGDQRVDMVLSYPGADGALIRSAIASGAAGLIVLGGGAGNPGSALVEAIAEATQAGVVVGLASRTFGGSVAAIYSGGGAVDALAAGAVALGDLPGTQARVLLALLLSTGAREETKDRLERWVQTAR
ncbi:asparaginase [Nesterenkonia sp. AN1]|uniref:asparaginase n=1 Tax=Nesterenkonia aurantiaca TaxID=1436010 RepID=A0A4R7FZG8_9MICC|nr:MULTISPECIES: asparaginase [Nesterenkonia]EXF25793.1 asparaginase [Nesterenkonia sp. AN1]TDS84261.1 asparaginase [Nesterenkonia aurantiaca]